MPRVASGSFAGAGSTTISTAPLSLAAATFDGPSELSVAGPGAVGITSSPQLGTGSKLTVNGGMLRFGLTSAAPSIGTGVTAEIDAGATLELAGSVSALASGPARVNIVNSSTTAGVLVTGQNQRTGSIDGGGSTAVAPSADLTADHIIQSALIIEGAPGQPGLVTIAGSGTRSIISSRPT